MKRRKGKYTAHGQNGQSRRLEVSAPTSEFAVEANASSSLKLNLRSSVVDTHDVGL